MAITFHTTVNRSLWNVLENSGTIGSISLLGFAVRTGLAQYISFS